MSEFMQAQIEKIKIEKWQEGVRRDCDPGDEYVVWWVLQNGAWFRKAWDNSLCSNCLNNSTCGYQVQIECDRFSSRGIINR